MKVASIKNKPALNKKKPLILNEKKVSIKDDHISFDKLDLNAYNTQAQFIPALEKDMYDQTS